MKDWIFGFVQKRWILTEISGTWGESVDLYMCIKSLK